MRRVLVGLVVVLVAAAVGALSVWLGRDEGGHWVAFGGIEPDSAHRSECAALPHISDQATFVSTGGAPGEPSEGVAYTVEGRDAAYEVALCLRNLGATHVRVERCVPRTHDGRPSAPRALTAGCGRT